MKRNLAVAYAVLLALALFCSACALKELKPTPGPATKDALLFAKAERLFEAKSYDAALAAYQLYVAQYPGMPKADAALMKIGMIRLAQGDISGERQALQRLVAGYPQSPLILDARVALLESLYSENKYGAAIEGADSLLKDTFLSQNQLVRIYSLLGDSYAATARPMEAAQAYVRAYQKAEAQEQPSLWTHFKAMLPQLTMADIDQLLISAPEGPFGGYFLYQLGLGLSDLEKDRESIRALRAMVKVYPDHPLVPKAEELLRMLAEKTHYDRFTIGCLLPLTGAYKAYGHRALEGIELAMDQVGGKGADSRLRIVVKDTASDPMHSADAARALCEDKVAAILGPIVTAFPAAQVAQQYGVPIITLTGREGITQVGDYVFRNFMTPRMQVQALVPYAIHHLGLRRFAILYPEEKYGTTMMNLFWNAVVKYGGVVTGVESYGSKTVDFADPIEKLVGLYYKMPEDLKEALRQAQERAYGTSAEWDVFCDPASLLSDIAKASSAKGDGSRLTESNLDGTDASAAPGDEEDAVGAPSGAQAPKKPEAIVDFDAVFIPDAPSMVGLIAPQLAFHDVTDVTLLGTNLWHSKDLMKMARQYVQGAVFPDGFFKESTQPRVKAFVEAFEGTYAQTPGFIEAVAYDSANMLLGLVKRPNILFRSALRDEIAAIRDYPGVTGRTSFTATGDVNKDLYLLKISGGRFHALPVGR